MSHTMSYGAIDPEADPDGDRGGLTGRLIPLDAEHREGIHYRRPL